MADMSGKVALITGAKGGLGSSVTKAFLDAGATVIGVSRSIQANDFASERFIAIPAELSSEMAADRLVRDATGAAGRIDTLAHLVGGFAGGAPVAETDAAILEEMWNVNVRSTFFIVQAVLRHMRDRGAGRIIAVGSRAAVESGANAGAYAASKAAVLALIRAVAAENADLGITANAVLPGTIDTGVNRKAMPNADFTKWVKPEDIARLILSLASDLSAVSGAAIPIYGKGV